MPDRQQLIERLKWLAEKTGAGLEVCVEKPLLRETIKALERDAVLEEQANLKACAENVVGAWIADAQEQVREDSP